MKPNFLVIGAAKCASTTLSALLGLHPSIYMVPHEVGFFAMDDRYSRGVSWYENLFSGPEAENEKCLGENSNHYTMKERYPLAIERLVNYFNPSDLKLIYIVRDPLEMIESFWIQIRSHGGEDVHYDFNVAVKRNRERLTDVANYWQQIQAYRNHFKDDQILIIFLEDFKANRLQVMQQCYGFLGVDPDFAFELPDLKFNPSKGKRITSPLKSRLRQVWGYKAIPKLLPKTIKNALNQRFFKKISDTRPTWESEQKLWVIREIAKDTQTFLEYCEKPNDFWSSIPGK